MSKINNFDTNFNAAEARQKEDIETIMRTLPGCYDVKKANKETDKAGVDYIARSINDLGTYTYGIDVKRREAGASKYWQAGPEICFEIVAQEEQGVTGWLADSQADYNLYIFDKSDCTDVYLIPLILLRMVWTRYSDEFVKTYGYKRQFSKGYYESWSSKAVFVPIFEVYKKMYEIMGRTKPQKKTLKCVTN